MIETTGDITMRESPVADKPALTAEFLAATRSRVVGEVVNVNMPVQGTGLGFIDEVSKAYVHLAAKSESRELTTEAFTETMTSAAMPCEASGHSMPSSIFAGKTNESSTGRG
jgi:hypothetical protein